MLNHFPPLNQNTSKTQCCPEFDPKPWDEQTFELKDKLFLKAKTFNFLHIPLNMGSVMTKTWKKITDAGAYDGKEFVLLSYDPSAWVGEHFFTVTKEVLGEEHVRLTGTFLAKVYEGSYDKTVTWMKDMESYVTSKGKKVKKMYSYYTTCPKCAKTYGKNYVVLFAQVA